MIEELSKLKHKLEIEEEFSDSKIKRRKSPKFNIYEQGVTSYIFKDLIAKLGNLKGKKVLDFGCGTGWTSVLYAKKGAYVSGFDISAESLKQAIKSVEEHNVKDSVFLQKMTAEKLNYAPESFDIVVGISVLHHTILPLTIAEIHRVLRKGGKAFFVEPLGHNPFIKLFRKLTPWRRSPEEKPLLIKDIEICKEKFSIVNFQGYYLLALLSFILFYLPGCRGWFDALLKFLLDCDKAILKMFPFLQKYCWNAIIELRK